jgi:hypothetical protein
MFKKYIKREIYTDRIKPFIDKDLIKVIVGQRRVGKSYLIFQIIDLIKEKHKNVEIIYINKELNEFDDIKNYQDLLDYVKKESKTKKRKYLFIDEIQDIDNFEKALRSLAAQGGYDIYCTGSNSNLLSGELATYLSGRYIEIEVFGLLYEEFLAFHKLSEDQESLLKYIKYGGLPYLINLELKDEIVYNYLKNVYSTILHKDVINRYKIRHPAILENLVDYLADNTGSIVSAKKISDFLKSQNIKISSSIISDYLSFLVNAFFIFKVNRLEVKGKKIFEVNSKYFFEDLGLRHSVIGYKQIDINKILENLVFFQLQVMGYQVFVGKLGDKEIDFVAQKQNQKIYIQVAYHLTEENRHREVDNLLEIKDNNPKLLISMDEMIGDSNYQGIKHLHIRDFLLGKDKNIF